MPPLLLRGKCVSCIAKFALRWDTAVHCHISQLSVLFTFSPCAKSFASLQFGITKMTNLGPLTTAFLPATDCNSVVHGYVHTETNPSNASDSTTYKYHSLGLTTTSACFPPGFRPSADAFYSPGICPSDMVSACGSIEAIGTITETRATCCPRWVAT